MNTRAVQFSENTISSVTSPSVEEDQQVGEGKTDAMTNRDFKRILADQTVTNWSQWASVAGFVTIPVVDLVAVGGLQIKMIADLCSVYNVPFKKSAVKAVLSALVTSSATSFTGATLSASLAKYIPYVGTSVALVTQPSIAYATTYALGAVFIKHFEAEGSLNSFSMEKLKSFYETEYKRAKGMFRKKSPGTPIESQPV